MRLPRRQIRGVTKPRPKPTAPPMRIEAVLSKYRRYRYFLSRTWNDALPPMLFIMLNPSTANEREDDPTIRRCISFAKREGCGAVWVVNLFAFRASKPAQLLTAKAPVGGSTNDKWIKQSIGSCVRRGGKIVCAWGALASNKWDKRAASVISQAGYACALGALFCLGRTKHMYPRHPLYVLGDAPLQRFFEDDDLDF